MTRLNPQARVLAAHERPRRLRYHPPGIGEGAGNTGCLPHPQPRVGVKKNHTSFSHHRYAKHSGIPCAMVLTVASRSPRRPGFVVSVARGGIRKLSASLGAPGPHDFAVRNHRRTSRDATASTASRLAFPDVRETPLSLSRDGRKVAQFLKKRKKILAAHSGYSESDCYS
jgi:hypothetical protein